MYKEIQKIRAFDGHIYGMVEEDFSTGKQQVREFATQHVRAVYDPKTGKTYDFFGRIIGEGNLLSMVLMDYVEGRRK